MSATVVDDEVLLARAYLSRVTEPPAPALMALVADVGPVEAAARVRRGAVSEEVAAETSTRRGTERAAADLVAAREVGARLLVPEHEAWPHWAFAAFGFSGAALVSPLALWVRGDRALASCTEAAVSVVGSRAASGYGVHVAGELGAGLGRHGFTVVSGAALGIDGAAHRGALAVEATTVAVLACGLDRAYPSAHSTLLDHIADQGLVVSEYPPGCVPGRHRFLVRNRLIAALGGGTVVVEAARRSGARRTAADTLALGRPLMAVPGPVTSAMSVGCHELIRAGAELVTCAEDVMELAGRMGEHLAERPRPRDDRPTDGLDPVAALVHDALPTKGLREVDWLAKEAGVPIGAVRVALTELSRRALAEEHDGRWQRC